MSKCRLEESNVHGIGIFATEDIKENAVLFHTHMKTPVPDSDRGCCRSGEWVNLSPNYLYNHSGGNANCSSVTSGTAKALVTLREIKKGEEILVDYTQDKDLEQPRNNWV